MSDNTVVETTVPDSTTSPTPSQSDLTLAISRGDTLVAEATARGNEIVSLAQDKAAVLLSEAQFKRQELIDRVTSGLPLERRGRPAGVKNGTGKKVVRKALVVVNSDGSTSLKRLGAGRPPKGAVLVDITPELEGQIIEDSPGVTETVAPAVAVG